MQILWPPHVTMKRDFLCFCLFHNVESTWQAPSGFSRYGCPHQQRRARKWRSHSCKLFGSFSLTLPVFIFSSPKQTPRLGSVQDKLVINVRSLLEYVIWPPLDFWSTCLLFFELVYKWREALKGDQSKCSPTRILFEKNLGTTNIMGMLKLMNHLDFEKIGPH